MAEKMKTVLCSLAMASLVAGASAQAEDDVLERIKPVGQVNIAGKTAAVPAAQAAAPAAATPAAPAVAPASAPAAPAPAAPAASSHPGAAAYQAKGCAGCHGADGKTTIMPVYPKISGQSATYLLAQMKDIKSGTRANGQTAVMKGIIAGVSEEEMKAIAEWLSTLQP